MCSNVRIDFSFLFLSLLSANVYLFLFFYDVFRSVKTCLFPCIQVEEDRRREGLVRRLLLSEEPRHGDEPPFQVGKGVRINVDVVAGVLVPGRLHALDQEVFVVGEEPGVQGGQDAVVVEVVHEEAGVHL